VGLSGQDFTVLPRDGPAWTHKVLRMVSGFQHAISLPSDVEKKYQILSDHPIQVPSSLLEYLRVHDGLHFTVASSSLLVEGRCLNNLYHCDLELFRNALSDLNSLIPLLSSR